MKHLIYKITCTVTGKFYIGMHSTNNPEDGYFGSGKLLKLSVRKHGKEKHVKEILEELPSREALQRRERELVNEKLLENPLSLNLKVGGEGGFANSVPWNKGKKCPIISENVKKQVKSGNFHCIGDYHRGKNFTDTHKLKLKEKAQNRKKLTCLHCGMANTPAMHARWHGENCKRRR